MLYLFSAQSYDFIGLLVHFGSFVIRDVLQESNPWKKGLLYAKKSSWFSAIALAM